MSIEEFNTTQPKRFIMRAFQLAHTKKHEYVTLEHLLYVLLEDESVVDTLLGFGADVEDLINTVNEFMDSDIIPTSDAEPKLTELFNEAIEWATISSLINAKRQINPIDLLLSIVSIRSRDQSPAAYMLLKNGIVPEDLKIYIGNNPVSETTSKSDGNSIIREATIEQPDNQSTELKILSKFCVNLNDRAKKGSIDPLIGREEEVARIIQIIARRTKNNLVLVGDPGVGKTVLMEGLAKRIVDGDVPNSIKDSTIWSLDLTSILAGSRYRGDVEEKFKFIIQIMAGRPKDILFIDEIHTIMSAGAAGQTGAMDISNIMKPALARGELRCIGSSTYEEYRKHFEKDRALVRRFQPLDIVEPSIEDTKRILQGIRKYYEDFHKVSYTDDALNAAVELSAKHIHNKFLPDKAIDIIDSSGASRKVTAKDGDSMVITVEDIEKEISSIAKVPVSSVKINENEALANLGKDLKSKIYGQDQAIEALEDAVLMGRAGLREENKSLGSYLFTGPTGTGKTATAQGLAKALGIPLVRIDMSEFMEKHSVSRLIGAPPGYVGYNDGGSGSGLLINEIDKNPHCVLLLDEVEKAHNDVYNILLQVMDHGELTSSTGKTVSFREVILIMTANLGTADTERPTIGFGNQERTPDEGAVKRFFPPEFRNRLDQIIDFNPLTKDNILKIVDKFIDSLNSLSASKLVTVELTDEAKNWLAEHGYDPVMGARPLSRVIDEHIKKPLARKMLFGELKTGGKITVKVEEESLVLA